MIIALYLPFIKLRSIQGVFMPRAKATTGITQNDSGVMKQPEYCQREGISATDKRMATPTYTADILETLETGTNAI
jgi:hypothetical protein